METIHLTDLLDLAQIKAPQPNFVEVQAFVIADMCLTAVFQHPNSQILWPELIPSQDTVLSSRLAIKPVAWSEVTAAVRFSILLYTAKGEKISLYEHEIDARNGSERCWHDCTVSLQDWAQQRVRLCFITEVENGRTGMAWAGWGDPQVSSSSFPLAASKLPQHCLPQPLPKSPPLVLLITCDALRRDHLSCYGNSPVATPHLDKLATEGVLLENSRTNSDTTLGSYTAMLAGKMPHVTGVNSEWGEFPTQLVSLPQLFADAGYRTVFAPSELEVSDASSRISSIFSHHVPALGNPAQQSGLTSRRLMRHLAENPPSAESPVFAWMQLFEPHPPSLPDQHFVAPLYPYDPRSEERRYRSEVVGRLHGVETVHSFSLHWPKANTPMPAIFFDRFWATAVELERGGVGGPDLARHLVSLGPPGMLGMSPRDFGAWMLRELQFTRDRPGDVTPAFAAWLVTIQEKLGAINRDLVEHMQGVVDWRYAEALYASSVASVDHAVGAVLAKLKAMGIFDEAVILFTSPHGEGISPQDGGLMHHHYLGEEVLRTPGILKLPSTSFPHAHGLRSRALVQTTDIAATLLAAAGCPTVGFFSPGQNRLSAILANETSPHAATASLGMQAMQSCLVVGNHKLMRYHDSWQHSATGRHELWHCDETGQATVVSSPDPALLQQLAEELEKRIPASSQDWLGKLPPAWHGMAAPAAAQAGQQHAESSSEKHQQEKMRGLEQMLKERNKANDQLHKQLAAGVKRLRELQAATTLLTSSRRWKLANLLRKDTHYAPLKKIWQKTDQWIQSNVGSEQRLALGTEKYPQWLHQQRPTVEQMQIRLRSLTERHSECPQVGILMPNPSQRAQRSLQEQSYPHWTAWIVTEDGIPREDPFRTLSAWPTTLQNLPKGPTHWLAMGGEDELEPHALLELAESICRYPQANFLHTDEDEISEGGKVSNPLFKPEWSPELLEALPYTGALAAISTDLLGKIQGSGNLLAMEHAYDLVLRCAELPDFHLQRVPSPLYHRRTLVPQARKNQAVRDLHALRQALDRREELAQATMQADGRTFRVQRLLTSQPKVTILIPTRNQATLLSRCLSTLQSLTLYRNYEIVILDNDSNDPDALRLLAACGHRVIKIPGPFNYAGMNNVGARETTGDMILLLNNDTEVLEPNWLGAMIEHAQRPEIGAVGAKLLFPDHTVQHAGVVLGIQGRAAHAFAGCDPAASLARRQLQTTRNYSALTAACLLMRREVYEQLNGFDEERFKVAYNDVDLCIRALRLGYRNVYTPHAVLRHHECASRPRVDNPHEVSLLQARCFGTEVGWTDPFYHPLLNQNSPNFDLAY